MIPLNESISPFTESPGFNEDKAFARQLKSGMLHDFNNMISVILGNASIALSNLHEGDSGFEELREISLAATRAKNLATRILGMDRGVALSSARVPISNLILDTFNMMKCLVPGHVRFNLALSTEPLYVHADKCLLEQVLVNLCKNAVHAMPEGGTLTIKTHELSGRQLFLADEDAAARHYVIIEVIDTGRGIPKSEIRKIFEPFYSTKARNQGSGLGLFISKMIIQNHHGHLFANSNPGGGAVFSIYLPLAASEQSALQ